MKDEVILPNLDSQKITNNVVARLQEVLCCTWEWTTHDQRTSFFNVVKKMRLTVGRDV